MQCRNCGRPLQEGTKFCQSCGTKVTQVCSACGMENDPARAYCSNCGNALRPNAAPPVQRNPVQTAYTQPAYPQPAYPQPGYGQPPRGPAAPLSSGRLRSLFSSTTMLVGCILLSVSLLFSLFASTEALSRILSLLRKLGVYGELSDAVSMMGMSGLLNSLTYASGASFFSSLMQQWQLVVILIGLWCTFAAARNTAFPVMQDGGLKAIGVVSRILQVCGYILMGILSILLIVAAIKCADSGLDDFTATFIAALLIFDTCLVLYTQFFGKVCESVNAIRSAVQQGRDGCLVPGYPIGIINILAVFAAISALIGLFVGGFSAFASSGCRAAALFVFAACLKKCRPQPAFYR